MTAGGIGEGPDLWALRKPPRAFQAAAASRGRSLPKASKAARGSRHPPPCSAHRGRPSLRKGHHQRGADPEPRRPPARGRSRGPFRARKERL